MRIRIKSILGGTMSWAIVMRHIIDELDDKSDLFLDSINGYNLLNKKYLKRVKPCFNADLDLTYTIPNNFHTRFNDKSKVKAAIYNYESSILPEVWRGRHKSLDYILPSSEFSKNVFLNSGYPESKLVVIPHGVRHDQFCGTGTCLDIDNSYFNFLNISIPHHRKNIGKLIEAYYLEFSEEDNVCLNIKSSIIKPTKYFEINILDEIERVQKRFDKKLPPIKILTKKYSTMFELYNSCDALISTTSGEGFGLPILEAMASKLLVVAPIQTGQADFLNKHNCIEVMGSYIDSPKEYQYWGPSSGSKIFMPSISDIMTKMRQAYNFDKSNMLDKAYACSLNYTWENAARRIVGLI
tara:strand:- start:998 stop:2056 length:1059 start_codon:yes stop_codon:yes gene_type:complete